MGTAPVNFPADAILEVGQLLTGNKLNLTASMALTTFFTAPVAGLYMLSMAIRIISTNGAGSLAASFTPSPRSGALVVSVAVTTDPIIPAAIVQDIAPAGPTDGFCAGVPVWLNAGEVARAQTTASGLTGTTYSVFVVAQRLF